MGRVLAVDVDLTVVDTLTPWLDWFESLSGKRVLNLDHNYDLVPEMKLLMAESGTNFDPFAYWKRFDLYDDMKPIANSVYMLNELSLIGLDIIFVSSCIHEHTQSKINFLDKHFPFHQGFISTKEKHFVGYDILIDDKIDHLAMGSLYRPQSKHILFTGCRVDGEPGLSHKYTTLSAWNQLMFLL